MPGHNNCVSYPINDNNNRSLHTERNANPPGSTSFPSMHFSNDS